MQNPNFEKFDSQRFTVILFNVRQYSTQSPSFTEQNNTLKIIKYNLLLKNEMGAKYKTYNHLQYIIINKK